MEYITTKEASAKWGISTSRITLLANEGRIPGAQRLGKSWLIPANAIKPPERKANHTRSAKKEVKQFSFPLYHFRSDWCYIKETQLSKQQQDLIQAGSAVLECRFADAYPLLESILPNPDDIYVEIGCLWNAGICCIALNKPDEFSKIYLRLQMLLSKDCPHRNDLVVILDILKTYVDTIGSSARNNSFNMDINEQCLPLMSLKIGYEQLTKETIKSGSADVILLELNLRFLETTSTLIAVEMMHCHLLGIHYMRQNMEAAEKHAKAIVKIAFENKLYFPLVTYYRYFTPALEPILAQYPEEFQNLCHKMSSQYEYNFTAFLSGINEHSVISKLNDADYPYIYAIMTNLSNTRIADKLGVSQQTVNNRLAIICRKLGVKKNKKALKKYLYNYI